MAKCEYRLRGDFNGFLNALNNEILSGSISASLEDGSDIILSDVQCAVRVYERYSYIGGNRVSLNITVVGRGNDLYVTAITSGGSQAVFFKVNTFGESAFLDKVIDFIERYQRNYRG
ncbi:MAG: hypothetical protein IKT57_02425 [Clostridia bacterium]|nr:hypothetical protein [Clostridia bacterium]